MSPGAVDPIEIRRVVELLEAEEKERHAAMDEAKAAWERSLAEWEAVQSALVGWRAYSAKFGQEAGTSLWPLPSSAADGVMTVLERQRRAWNLDELLMEFSMRGWDIRLGLKHPREAIRVALRRLLEDGRVTRMDSGSYVKADAPVRPSLRLAITTIIRESHNRGWVVPDLVDELLRRHWLDADSQSPADFVLEALENLQTQGVAVVEPQGSWMVWKLSNQMLTKPADLS